MSSHVAFLKSGIMKSEMRIAYFRNGAVFAEALVQYRSRYEVIDGTLVDHPISAKIRSFNADGQDIRNSSLAKDLEQMLISESDEKPEIQFRGANKMDLVRKDGSKIQCTRDSKSLETS